VLVTVLLITSVTELWAQRGGGGEPKGIEWSFFGNLEWLCENFSIYSYWHKAAGWPVNALPVGQWWFVVWTRFPV